MRNSAIALFTGILLSAATAASAGMPAFPHQKPGLWQQTISMGGKDIVDQVCLDAASEAKLSALGAQAANTLCKSKTVTHNPDGSWTSDSTCQYRPGWTTISHMVVTGDFDSKYRAVIDSTTTGAPVASMNGAHQSIVASSRLGACKPGQKGGDVIMSNGMKVNVLTPPKPQH